MLKKLRLTVDKIQPQFPDCIAYQKTGGEEKEIRIEFEYKSLNFKTHRHDPKGCDWIVCWEHNWPDKPKHLQVVELRKEFGLGSNVWIQPVSGKYKEILSDLDFEEGWSVPSLSHKNDLILYYHTSPDQCIKDIFKRDSDVGYGDADWKEGKDYMGSIRRICQLKSPIFLEDMRHHKILSTSSFVRGTMQGRPRATEYWPYLFDMIIRRNPSVKKTLAKYDPENF
jgi:hypothetical protein